MSRYPITGATRLLREQRAFAIRNRARMLVRECSVDWSVDPPEVVFTPDLSVDEDAVFVAIPADAGPNTRIVGMTGTTQGPPVTVNLTTETPAGAINGTNDTYALSRTPAILLLFRNGLLLQSGAQNDYTLSGSAVTFLAGNICQPGDSLIAVLI